MNKFFMASLLVVATALTFSSCSGDELQAEAQNEPAEWMKAYLLETVDSQHRAGKVNIDWQAVDGKSVSFHVLRHVTEEENRNSHEALTSDYYIIKPTLDEGLSQAMPSEVLVTSDAINGLKLQVGDIVGGTLAGYRILTMDLWTLCMPADEPRATCVIELKGLQVLTDDTASEQEPNSEHGSEVETPADTLSTSADPALVDNNVPVELAQNAEDTGTEEPASSAQTIPEGPVAETRAVFAVNNIIDMPDGSRYYDMSVEHTAASIEGLGAHCLVAAAELQRYKAAMGTLVSTSVVWLEAAGDALVESSGIKVIAHVLPADVVATVGKARDIATGSQVLMEVVGTATDEDTQESIYTLRISPELNSKEDIASLPVYLGQCFIVLGSELKGAKYSVGDVVCTTLTSLESLAGIVTDDLGTPAQLAHVRPCE